MGYICDYDPKADDYTAETIELSRVHCPNHQCSGNLYFEENPSYGEQAWQFPDIKCDDCGTRWQNGLRRERAHQT
jgi:hypothetical protein